MRRQKLSSHRQKGLNEQDSLDMPVEGQKGIEMTSSSEISKDSIIQKLQMGDYKGARELMKKLGNFEGNKEEKGIIDAIMAEVHDYLSELPEGRRDDILKVINGEEIPGGKTHTKYVIEKMSKLNKYNEFTKAINEQMTAVNAGNIKTVEFPALLSSFENLAGKKAQLTDEERTLLNNVRGEIQTRYTRLGGK